MLNEWDLLAYIQRQLAAGVPLLTLQLVPDLSGTGRRPAPDAPDAYGHARDADGRTYALGPDWPGAWCGFWTRERVPHVIQRPIDNPSTGIGTFQIGPAATNDEPF